MADVMYVLAKWLEGQLLEHSRWWELGDYSTLEAACAAGNALSTGDDLLAIRLEQRTRATRVPGEAWQLISRFGTLLIYW